jgi:hypothetical protein
MRDVLHAAVCGVGTAREFVSGTGDEEGEGKQMVATHSMPRVGFAGADMSTSRKVEIRVVLPAAL